MSWLARLRWAAILGQGLVITYVHYRLGSRCRSWPSPRSWAEVSSIAGSSSGFQVSGRSRSLRLRQRWRLTSAASRGCCIDRRPAEPVQLSLPGAHRPRCAGPASPVGVDARAVSLGANGALFVTHVPLPMGHDMSDMSGMHGMHDMHAMHGEALGMHLRGMWVAFAVAAGSSSISINRVTRALAEREAELGRAREIAGLARNSRRWRRWQPGRRTNYRRLCRPSPSSQRNCRAPDRRTRSQPTPDSFASKWIAVETSSPRWRAEPA